MILLTFLKMKYVIRFFVTSHLPLSVLSLSLSVSLSVSLFVSLPLSLSLSISLPLSQVRDGLSNMVMKTLGPCTVVQAAVPGIIQNVPAEYHERNISILQVSSTQHTMLCLS